MQSPLGCSEGWISEGSRNRNAAIPWLHLLLNQCFQVEHSNWELYCKETGKVGIHSTKQVHSVFLNEKLKNDVQRLSHWLLSHASFFSVFKMHVPAVPKVLTRLVQTYKLHGFFFLPHLPRRHVCSSIRSYTDFPGLVEIAAERKRGASLHGLRQCSQAGCPQLTMTLEIRLSKTVTCERAPL
jgi:hypothetical protein